MLNMLDRKTYNRQRVQLKVVDRIFHFFLTKYQEGNFMKGDM